MKKYSFVYDHMGECHSCDMEENEEGEYIKTEDADKLLIALKKIYEFGRANPGCGFSCSKIAEEALKSIEAT